MTDRQLPIEPTVRIDPSTQVEHMCGTDAICMCKVAQNGASCAWPFCGWQDHIEQEDA